MQNCRGVYPTFYPTTLLPYPTGGPGLSVRVI